MTESATLTAIWGKNAKQVGETPAIALINPKNSPNVAMVIRLASCYGVPQVWWTGNRVNLDTDGQRRLPREERMKGYQDVSMVQYDRIFDQFPNATPVAVEVRDGSQSLLTFTHPTNPLYVFGPEDGGLTSVTLRHCHQFVVIPTKHCLNLATAVATILWDWMYKRYVQGEITVGEMYPGQHERRGFDAGPSVFS